MDTQFVHLHCHSHFSSFNGTASPTDLVERTKKYGMSALALTDYCNLHGIPEFCHAAKNYGIKPILGMEAAVAGVRQSVNGTSYGVTLLAMNEEGWRNLLRLSSFDNPEKPIIEKDSLRQHNFGLLCLSGFAGGEIGRLLTDDIGGGYEKAKDVARWYQETFGDRYYLELRNHGIESQKTLFAQTVKIGSELQILTVATNDIHYLDQVDWRAHDTLLRLKNNESVSDEDRPKMGSDQHYFRSADEMLSVFPGNEITVHRTVEIAERIQSITQTVKVILSKGIRE